MHARYLHMHKMNTVGKDMLILTSTKVQKTNFLRTHTHTLIFGCWYPAATSSGNKYNCFYSERENMKRQPIIKKKLNEKAKE